MKILIFGAGGMIGHQMFRVLSKHNFLVFGTLKKSYEDYSQFSLFQKENSFENLDILDKSEVLKVLTFLKPEVVLNCVGVTLRKAEIKDEKYCSQVNTEFPHFLDKWCSNHQSYLIHFSTDCVFSGKSGPYSEESRPDATDVYGVTKAKGELYTNTALTLRGSMIGRELFGKTELLEWALSQKNKSIKGYSGALYSGVTTSVMAGLVAKILKQPERLTGLYQVSSEPISKYELLVLINAAFKLNMLIGKDESYTTEKILTHEKLKRKLGFGCPSWTEMVDELAKDLFKY